MKAAISVVIDILNFIYARFASNLRVDRLAASFIFTNKELALDQTHPQRFMETKFLTAEDDDGAPSQALRVDDDHQAACRKIQCECPDRTAIIV